MVQREFGEGADRSGLFEQIVADGPAVAFVWRLEEGWPVEFVSDAIDQFGYRPDALLSGAIAYADIVHPGDLARVVDEIADHLHAGATEFFQHYRLIAADGDTRWVDDWTTVVRDDAGHATHARGIILDVTARRSATDRMQRAFEATGSLFVHVSLDGTILDTNHSTSLLTDTPVDELIGTNWIESFVPDDERDQARTAITDIVDGRFADPGEYANEIEVHCERHLIRWHFTVDRDADEKAVALICFGHDITPMRELLTARNHLADVHRHNPHTLLQIERSGTPVLANERAEHLLEALDGDEAWTEFLARALGATTRFEERLRLAGSSYLFHVVPAEEHVTVYGADITRQRESEERLLDIAVSVPGALFGYTRDVDGADTINFMNEEVERIWEVNAEGLDGDPEQLWAMILPEDMPDMQRSVAESSETLVDWFHEWRIRPASGRIKWLQGRGHPRRLPDGGTHWTTLIADVTEVKTLTEARIGTLKQSISALASVVEVRDPYTAGHERNVASVAVAIARKMELPAHQVEGLELAAMIHDIGKIAIPAEILNKPARLTDLEYVLVQSHPGIGAGVVRDIEFEWPIADIIEQHHERLDGSGYPAGLRGDEICIEARIIAVADTLDAMASHRPYRPGRGVDEATTVLTEGRGVLFDADAVDACLALVARGAFDAMAYGGHRESTGP